MIRALFVYRWLTMGGVESLLRARQHVLREAGHQPHVWFLFGGGGAAMFGDHPESINVGGLGELARCAVEFDIVSVIDTPEALRRLRHHRNVIAECHSTYPTETRYLEGDIPARALLVPSQSQRLYVAHRRRGHEPPIRVVRNILGPEFLKPLRPTREIGTSPIMWVGRIDTHKRWDLALEVAARVKVDRPPEVWVATPPAGQADADGFSRRAQALDVLDRTRWWQGMSSPQISRLYDLARACYGVALCTSTAESFGYSVVEAMARGCPIIAPDAPPFTEHVVHAKTGMLYEPGSGRSAADAISELSRHRDLWNTCAQGGREFVERVYGPRSAGRDLVEALEELTIGQASP